jgi:hypothetical protein
MDNKFELPREGVRIYDPKSGWQDSADNSNRAQTTEVIDQEQQHDDEPDDSQDIQSHDGHDDQADDETYDEHELDEEHGSELDQSFETEQDDQQENEQDESLDHDPHAEEIHEADPVNQARAHFSDSQAHSPEDFAAEALRSLSDNLSSGGALAGYAGPSAGKSVAGLVPQGQAAALAKVGDSLDGLFTVIQRSTLANTVDGSAPSWRDVANISRHLEGRLNTRQQLLKELSSVDREIRNTRDDLLVTLKALSDFEQQNLQAASMRASISSVAARVIAKRFEESGDT